jgi:hypothetical protein
MRHRNKCPNSAALVVAARAQQDFPASPDTGSRIRQVPAQSRTVAGRFFLNLFRSTVTGMQPWVRT